MDKGEMIALGIVALAVLLVIVYFIKQKGGGCCSKDCFKPGKPPEKK
ncbi:MAG TPA: FeoB-associated Cys-rich membrane protein [Candidatus Omnitrophota bacterium]|nr:FeoB-associated Cys-rich membrane protein [Candidatus Omnitrophota bacterium]